MLNPFGNCILLIHKRSPKKTVVEAHQEKVNEIRIKLLFLNIFYLPFLLERDL